MSAEQTLRDALIAETLGDIGKLHDDVKALKAALSDTQRRSEEILKASKSYSLPNLWIAGYALIGFGCFAMGWIIGSKASISMLHELFIFGTGVCLGYLLYWSSTKDGDSKILIEMAEIKNQLFLKKNEPWSDHDFNQALANSGKTLTQKNLAACREVLINGMGIDEAAAITGVIPLSVSTTVHILRKYRK